MFVIELFYNDESVGFAKDIDGKLGASKPFKKNDHIDYSFTVYPSMEAAEQAVDNDRKTKTNRWDYKIYEFVLRVAE